jgi:hypothetical protein
MSSEVIQDNIEEVKAIEAYFGCRPKRGQLRFGRERHSRQRRDHVYEAILDGVHASCEGTKSGRRKKPHHGDQPCAAGFSSRDA